MKIYFAAPTGKRRDLLLNEYGDKYGACQTRDVFSSPEKFKTWFFDNGAFGDFKKNLFFDSDKFLKRLRQITKMVQEGTITKPQFIVVPDIVAGGTVSQSISCLWLEDLKKEFPGNKWAIAVQDGMQAFYERFKRTIEPSLYKGLYDLVFVGGTKPWKYSTGESWVKLAHKYNLQCHIGGVGSRKAYLWANMIGADSVDSGLPMIHSKHLEDALNIENELLWNAA